MDHRGEAARPTTVESTEPFMAAAAVYGDEAHIRTGTFDSGQFLRRGSFDSSVVYRNSDEFPRHVRTAAGRGELLVAVFHGEPGPGVVYANVRDFWRQPGQGNEVHVAGLQLPDPEEVVPVDDSYGYYQLQPRSAAGRGEVHVHVLPDGAGHGEVIANLLTGAAGALDGPGNFAAQETLPATGRAEGNVGALRSPGIGAGHDGIVGEYLRRLLAFAGIGACSVAVNGLAAGPGSPAVAFHLFVLLLGGLFLVILHALLV